MYKYKEKRRGSYKANVFLLMCLSLTHEFSEAAQRKSAGSSDKLHETQPHFIVHFLYQLQGRE